MVSPILEEIWEDRIKSRVDTSKIHSQETLVAQIQTLPKTKSVTKYNRQLKKYTTFTVDFSRQQNTLTKHADVMIQSSTGLQKTIADNVADTIKDARIQDFRKIKIDSNLSEQKVGILRSVAKNRIVDLLDSIRLSVVRDVKDLEIESSLISDNVPDELFSFDNSSLKDQLDNRVFNFLGPQVTDAQNDPARLREIKESIHGFTFENELTQRIDGYLEKIER